MSEFKALLNNYGFSSSEENSIEALVVSVQLALQRSMSANCVTQKELAERLGLSSARVSQILTADGSNLTLKTIARVAYALEEEFELISSSEAASAFVETVVDKRDERDGFSCYPLKLADIRKRRVGFNNTQWDQGANKNTAPAETQAPMSLTA